MTYQEKMRANNERIKTVYNAKLVGNGKYKVETRSSMCNAWMPRKWIFENLEDAIAYCNNETKGSPARVCEYKMVEEENTLYTTAVYTKEVER